jgi:hypothetical protein
MNEDEDDRYIDVERTSTNPSSRPVKSKTFDRGSEEGDLTEKEVLEYLGTIKGNALVRILVEDCCYTVYEGSEQDLKRLASELVLESSDNSELEYYHNGKRTALKVEVEI